MTNRASAETQIPGFMKQWVYVGCNIFASISASKVQDSYGQEGARVWGVAEGL